MAEATRAVRRFDRSASKVCRRARGGGARAPPWRGPRADAQWPAHASLGTVLVQSGVRSLCAIGAGRASLPWAARPRRDHVDAAPRTDGSRCTATMHTRNKPKKDQRKKCRGRNDDAVLGEKISPRRRRQCPSHRCYCWRRSRWTTTATARFPAAIGRLRACDRPFRRRPDPRRPPSAIPNWRARTGRQARQARRPAPLAAVVVAAMAMERGPKGWAGPSDAVNPSTSPGARR